ncbi:MAG: hypothetical protein ACT6R2_17730 [Blastomonas fulva]|jgi:hypothetical protein|uniref:hypothetical protein n=1 Tax=Blastomonas TaxID=150203 RepID=UPI0006B928E9|nr:MULTISPECIES: hypothetical protein [Blastomonas]AOF99386.1 putative membrane protein [Blastomonas sp. RAC04]KPF76135.1 hypothetical protein IP68_06570 [Blastomonas sp. AAP25]MDM7927297.1 hypothetical protein [Blastomonas fulva]MDM7966414.1 hypothetical protein [Blastomonas fulva]
MTRYLQAVPLAMIVLVVTQLSYVVLSNSGFEMHRMVIWTTEAVAFLGITVLALVALAQKSRLAPAWAAIAVSGVLNVVQVGMGLAMFGPLKDAGEAMAPAYEAVVAGAFFLYFAGKWLFGLAAILVGAAMLRGTGLAKAAGVLAILSGLAAMAVNLLGMATGMAWIFPAGAAGTAATLLLAIALAMTLRERPEGQP